MAKTFPVYDILSFGNNSAPQGLLIERFAGYVARHYDHVHHPHRHSFYHLVLFTRGKGSHTIDFEKFPVKPMQIYFMIPGQVHSWHFEGRMEGYIIHFNAALFTSFLQNGQYLERFPFFSGHSEDGVCQLAPAVYQQVITLFETMLAEVRDMQGQYLDMIRVKLIELFVVVERFCLSAKGKHVPPQKLLLLRNFQQLIDKQFRMIRLPKEYAELLYITPNHLNALCQDLMGKTAGDLIRDRVLLEAKRLLTNADMTVTEIAYDLNFRDNSYFTRFFRKNSGITPEEFRKKVKG